MQPGRCQVPSGARPTGVSDIPSSSRRYATPGRPSAQWRPVYRCHRHHRRPPTPTISSVHTAAEGSTKPPPRGTFRFVRYDAELTPDKCCSQSNWCSHRAVTVADAKRKKRAHGRPPSIRIWNFFCLSFLCNPSNTSVTCSRPSGTEFTKLAFYD